MPSKSRLLFSTIMVALLGACASGPLLTIPIQVPIQEGTKVTDAVLAECEIERVLAKQIAREAKGPYGKVTMKQTVSGETPGHALEVRITQIHAPGGGKWSGPKILSAEGTLYIDGRVAGTFVAKRKTRHGRHTCRMLHNNAEEIAEDIAEWLKNPTMNARLGDAN